jgi:hypothetical protein
MVRFDGGEQLPPALHLERPADVDLAPALHEALVASEICLFPWRTFASTARMILSLGTSICGLRSGTQKWQRRPQPVVISTTPKVVQFRQFTRDSRLKVSRSPSTMPLSLLTLEVLVRLVVQP